MLSKAVIRAFSMACKLSESVGKKATGPSRSGCNRGPSRAGSLVVRRRDAHDSIEATVMKMKTTIVIATLVTVAFADLALAHPGSGIAVDRNGQVFFTQTNGKGTWKV